MSKRSRKAETFSLSFLDCICCGFGAIILLFIVSLGVRNTEILTLQRILENTILQRKLKLADYQIKKDELSVLLDLEQTKRKRIDKERNSLDALIAKLKQQLNDKEKAKDLYVSDLEEIKKELAIMQTDIDIEQKVIQPTPIGVPVESNYIAFVVDTSGSMRDSSTDLVRAHVAIKFEEVLEAYPEVKGFQLLDASGRFIMGASGTSRWIQDSKEAREAMVRAVRLYPLASESNPVPGIKRAIRDLYDPKAADMKLGIYVLGDEFTGKPEPVIEELKKLNQDKDGKRIARINAIGFPNVIQVSSMFLGQSGLKFAKLMHDVTYEHGGAFIALSGFDLERLDRENRDRFPAPIPPPSMPMPGGIIIRGI